MFAILDRAAILSFQSAVSQLSNSSSSSSNYFGNVNIFLLFSGLSSVRLELAFFKLTSFSCGSLIISFSDALFTFAYVISKNYFFLILLKIAGGINLLTLPDLSFSSTFVRILLARSLI